MKLSDNKYLLYRHRWIYPYVKILLGTIRFLAIVASLLLIVAFIYEHGFVISYADVETLSKVYHGVWIVFLVDIISHLLLRFGSTRQQMNIMSWLLVSLYLLTLVPVIFHQPDDGPIKQFWLLMNSRTYRLVMSMLLAFVTLSGGISRLLSRKANQCCVRDGHESHRHNANFHRTRTGGADDVISDRWLGRDDIHQFLYIVLYGQYQHL